MALSSCLDVIVCRNSIISQTLGRVNFFVPHQGSPAKLAFLTMLHHNIQFSTLISALNKVQLGQDSMGAALRLPFILPLVI